TPRERITYYGYRTTEYNVQRKQRPTHNPSHAPDPAHPHRSFLRLPPLLPTRVERGEELRGVWRVREPARARAQLCAGGSGGGGAGSGDRLLCGSGGAG